MVVGDTITAIATAPGRGGVAVVRVSGPDAFAIAEKLAGVEKGEAYPSSDASCEASAMRGASSPLVRIRKIRFPSSGGDAASPLIDEGVVLAFRSPHSYTGEDVVEFQCHGGAVTPRRVLEACLAAGARLARRGEFTERAFLNGKLDYDQAESVLDLVDAKTARAADAALEGLAGRKRRELKALYDAALDISTRLEHALDVDEGELADDYVCNLRSQISDLRFQIAEAIRRANEGKILREGALVVLAGPPNAGKSSLLNALLEENRAIVSDVPGTTRDSIEAWLDLDGWPIRLVDTAGLREAKDEVEGEGVRRSEDLIAKADVVVLLQVPGFRFQGSGFDSIDLKRETCNLKLIPIHPKCDLGRGPGLNVSAKTGEGLDELKKAIVARLEAKVDTADEGDVATGDAVALHEALALLDKGRGTEDERREEDLVLQANAVRGAAERLGAAVGATYSSDLLANLFSRFCVGK